MINDFPRFYLKFKKQSLLMKPSWQKKIAKERIRILFKEAERIFPKHKDLANRYVELARRIGMKYKVRVPKHLKRKFCKYCYRFIRPGVNSNVRIKNKKVIHHCNECGKDIIYGD